MMTVADIERITKVLESMIQYELNLSDFYKQCADAWEEDRAFWVNLAYAEVHHAENIQKMREIILKKQEIFELGRPFNLIALNTALAGLQDIIKRINQGLYSREKILVLARDIEQSLLESHYAEIVKTADIEYQTLMKNILSQTYEHRMMLQKRIDDVKSKS